MSSYSKLNIQTYNNHLYLGWKEAVLIHAKSSEFEDFHLLLSAIGSPLSPRLSSDAHCDHEQCGQQPGPSWTDHVDCHHDDALSYALIDDFPLAYRLPNEDYNTSASEFFFLAASREYMHTWNDVWNYSVDFPKLRHSVNITTSFATSILYTVWS